MASKTLQKSKRGRSKKDMGLDIQAYTHKTCRICNISDDSPKQRCNSPIFLRCGDNGFVHTQCIVNTMVDYVLSLNEADKVCSKS